MPLRFDRRAFLKLLPTAMISTQVPVVTTIERKRARELGIRIGTMQPGKWNAITDVPGIKVGHSTIIQGSGALKVGIGPVRTGVTAVWPHDQIFDEYLPFGFHTQNGNGEMTGLTQSTALGVIGSPIFLTNTSSVGMVFDAAQSRMLSSELIPIVGETWDAFLNDVEGRHVKSQHVFEAMDGARSGPVQEGNVGGGTGMICYGFKGGVGTASRRLPAPLQQYTLGVLVQANHGKRELLRIDGIPVGEEITDLKPQPQNASFFNSILIVIATDAPLLDYQLHRIARRGGMGLAKTGSVSSNSSGDFIVAFSTANKIKKSHFWQGDSYQLKSIEQFDIQPLFEAASEATEEAIVNALFMATTMVGRDGNKVYALPIDRVLKIMERHRRLFKREERKVAAL